MANVENIVVLMLENRSFDNMLGALYGLQPGSYSNQDSAGNAVPTWGSSTDPTTIPAVDPGEYFEDMAQQILGLSTTQPGGNPYSTPEVFGSYGATGGFVVNYQSKSGKAGFNEKDVMHFYVPSLVPVTAWLAQNFAVCEHWYGSAPTQTFANRMFAQCANPGKDLFGHSYINDLQYGVVWGDGGIKLPSVFGQLDAVLGTTNAPNWKLYFHDYSINGTLLNYVNSMFANSKNINVANYNRLDYPDKPPSLNPPVKNPLANPGNTFLEDVAGGTLAPFTFIEPRYSNNYSTGKLQMMPGLTANSNHPGPANYPLATVKAANPPIDVLDGELLLLEIYLTLRYSDYWANTLLIVTYDEHGGCFDHVTPPSATPPGIPKTGGGFNFDYFGPRVPTIVVSPFVAPGSTLLPKGKVPFDHTSIIKTAWDCFGLANGPHGLPSINQRDFAAPSLLDCLDLSLSNNPQDKPPTPNK